MKLIEAILNKVQSKESMSIGPRKYSSPPPELEQLPYPKPKKKYIHPYAHIRSRVDSSPPELDARFMSRRIPGYRLAINKIIAENMHLLMAIRRVHFTGGRVDSRWRPKEVPPRNTQYGERRTQFYKRVYRENLLHNQLFVTAPSRVATTAELRRDWRRNKQDILLKAQERFVLFPPVYTEDIEDPAFLSPGVKRPRVQLSLRIKGGASLGVLVLELFTDVCPLTCRLFTDLLAGDGLGHGYVGTRFFRKVPHLYWSGGDVIYNNGFGCYAQRGRALPIGAENYHFSHTMPGLVSMRMTCDDEMCGSFNITFKPLQQFDLRNVVFGRIIRPSATFDAIRSIGHPLNTQPVVEISATSRRVHGRWVHGHPNTKIHIPLLKHC